MKIKLFLLLLVLFTLSSCDGDDECTQDDWIGTYVGTQNCNGLTTDATMTVSAAGADMLIYFIETSAGTTEFDPEPFSGCNVNQQDEEDGIRLELDIELDGDMLTFRFEFSDDTESSFCEYIVTK